MATAVIMPQVGQDIETAIIVEWIKKENDPIQKGDTIATVESDKATFDVEALLWSPRRVLRIPCLPARSLIR